MEGLSRGHMAPSRHQIIAVTHPSFTRVEIVMPFGTLRSFPTSQFGPSQSITETQGTSCSSRRHFGPYANLPDPTLV